MVKKQLNNRVAYLLSQLQFFYKTITYDKLKNFLVVNYEYKHKKTKLKSMPYLAMIDPSNVCNLKCLICPNKVNKRKNSFMSFCTFKKIIDKVGHHLFSVGLFNMGEPFMNKEIFRMIKYAESKNIKTYLHSNMTLINKKNVDKLVNSGLRYITMSIDGASQNTYTKYRMGGDFNKIINNVKLIIKKKMENKTHFPFLEWKYMVFKYNEHEIARAEKMAKDIGVDFFRTVPFAAHTPVYKKINQKALLKVPPKSKIIYNKKTACYWLYKWLIINADGKVSCCCPSSKKKDDFGNINKENLKDIWNNRHFLSARSLLKNGKSKKRYHQIVCNQCQEFL
ncbi:MAG: radical SAM protein [Nanoarchaeota archaeon]